MILKKLELLMLNLKIQYVILNNNEFKISQDFNVKSCYYKSRAPNLDLIKNRKFKNVMLVLNIFTLKIFW
jgi:hypothetical protein